MSDDWYDLTNLVQNQYDHTISIQDINSTFYVGYDITKYNPHEWVDFHDFISVYGKDAKV